MTIVTAPDGAIFALLAIANAAPLPPDENAELWLREQFLIDDTAGGITELTSRGRAFVGMILATPIPQKDDRWIDPRDLKAAPAAPAPDLTALVRELAAALRPTAQPALPPIQAAPARPAPASVRQPEIVTSIPPGYTEVPEHWKLIPAGQWPAELRPDADVRVIYRDGRVSAPRAAQSVIWLHKDHPDDVLAFMSMGNDTIRPITSTPIN